MFIVEMHERGASKCVILAHSLVLTMSVALWRPSDLLGGYYLDTWKRFFY